MNGIDADLVARAVGERAGSYLVAIKIEVKILEEAAIAAKPLAPVAEVPSRIMPKLAELVA